MKIRKIIVKKRAGFIFRSALLFVALVYLGIIFCKNYCALYGENIAISVDNKVEPFFPEGTYDANIPVPDSILGFALGSKPANYNKLVDYIKHLSDISPCIQVRECGKTYEGRILYVVIISSEENMARLDEIRNTIAKLADPRKLKNEKEAFSIIEHIPAVAWLAYSIHGDELSSTDAALQLIYQLVAGNDSLTEKLRDELVIIIDPLQNPDGRERCISQLNQLAGLLPNPDPQSLQHSGLWPWGRGNHYLFDLNRDWFSLVNPETRGKVKAIFQWNPQLFVDSHEMGEFGTYLFSPPREPFNPNITETIKKWWKIFSQEQAKAFDKYGWSYYTRDWYEGWYPGFGCHWTLYSGCIGILYEQAGVQGSLVKRLDGSVLTYRETVHHQFISSMANLTTAAKHRKELLKDFYSEKKRALEQEPGSFIFPMVKNKTNINRFIETLLLQGVEVQMSVNDFVAYNLSDYWRQTLKSKEFSAGTYIISLNQPMRRLIKTILEFDPRMSDSFLAQERKELEREKESKIYEVSAWSVPMAFSINVYWTKAKVNTKTKLITKIEKPTGKVINQNPHYGYIFDYLSDDAIYALITFLQDGYKIRTAYKPFKIEGIPFSRGSLLLRKEENSKELNEFVGRVTAKTGITIYGVNTALSEEGPDLGSEQFQLLELPRIGIFTGSFIDLTSYGSLWYLLDRECQLRFSSLDINSIHWLDLDKYNLLIFPNVWGGPEDCKRIFGNHGIAKLKTWIEQGGTLIAIGAAAAFTADTSIALSNVRLRHQVLDKIEEYEAAIKNEKTAVTPLVETKTVWESVPKIAEKPIKESKEPALAELTKEDEKARLFMPRGAILRADLDQEHWLTSGLDNKMPVIIYTELAFMSKTPVQTIARLADEDSIRLSGLLWPEARSRWARTAYLTRERLGKGQIILFADEPYFRAYFHGTKQLLVNALILGPGCGIRRTAPW